MKLKLGPEGKPPVGGVPAATTVTVALAGEDVPPAPVQVSE